MRAGGSEINPSVPTGAVRPPGPVLMEVVWDGKYHEDTPVVKGIDS